MELIDANVEEEMSLSNEVGSPRIRFILFQSSGAPWERGMYE